MDGCEFLTANAAADALAAGELTSEELVEALLGRIERLDSRLAAFIAVYADEARAAAREADLARRAGQAAGRFHGVPIALKDIIDMEGRVTTGGSKVWESRVSPLTATLARRLMEAGLIVIGKTRTVEFAMGSWGTNRHMGTPWESMGPRRAPGARRQQLGVRRQRRRPLRSLGNRDRYRRFGPAPVGVERAHGTQGHLREGELPRYPAAGPHARHPGADVPFGRGCGRALPASPGVRS